MKNVADSKNKLYSNNVFLISIYLSIQFLFSYVLLISLIIIQFLFFSDVENLNFNRSNDPQFTFITVLSVVLSFLVLRIIIDFIIGWKYTSWFQTSPRIIDWLTGFGILVVIWIGLILFSNVITIFVRELAIAIFALPDLDIFLLSLWWQYLQMFLANPQYLEGDAGPFAAFIVSLGLSFILSPIVPIISFLTGNKLNSVRNRK
ncbi:MAG: hypothetical protein ACW981_18660 [Candidatus Hodarchaeales archaeon]|jgi:hypothetical protein